LDPPVWRLDSGEKSPQPDPNPETVRLATRLANEFVLRVLGLTDSRLDGDMLTAVVSGAIVAATMSHLNAREDGSYRFAEVDNPPQDSERWAVSVPAVSGSLGVPFETTRRHVKSSSMPGTASAFQEE
jgi:hypothetical protein